MSSDADTSRVFRARGRVWTRFWWAYLSFAVAYLVAVLLIDVSWVAGVCNLLVGLGWVVESRGSTIADASGLRLRRLRERVIPWSEVAALQVSGPMPGASAAVRLHDGSTVPLVGVRRRDLDDLEHLRRRAQPPLSERDRPMST
ncbi:PH domain-containing protein [Serinicoccus profundi]|uniref:PH domain-containing protein n=1 Tax=Serinicoccus profundi TaxID=1078471 RepID=UPI0011465362|nr:PH domain-containing protein [Serinicoccus profundi]